MSHWLDSISTFLSEAFCIKVMFENSNFQHHSPMSLNKLCLGSSSTHTIIEVELSPELGALYIFFHYKRNPDASSFSCVRLHTANRIFPKMIIQSLTFLYASYATNSQSTFISYPKGTTIISLLIFIVSSTRISDQNMRYQAKLLFHASHFTCNCMISISIVTLLLLTNKYTYG